MNAPVLLTPDLFKTVSSHWPSGVAVTTATASDGSLHGLTMSGVISLSLDPMQFLISLDRKSNTLPVLKATKRFCINFLGKDQRDICMLFASKAADKFASISYQLSDMGLPIIEGVVACVSCNVSAIIPSGDHEIVIGNVSDIKHFGGEPLVHFKRAFHSIQAG